MERIKNIGREIYWFISTRLFLLNFLKMLGVIAGVVFLCTWGLRCYTNHGDYRTMGNYVGKTLAEAERLARKESFRVAVTDSVFVPGKPATTVLEQVPLPSSRVKEHRTVYVTIVKSKADQIPITRVTSFYGKSYELKKKELLQNFQIDSKIAGYQYDAGAPDYILAVLYKGDTIVSSNIRNENVLVDKGDVLEFILSKQTGADIQVPDVTCKTLEEARFMLDSYGLQSSVTESGNIPDPARAYVALQDPAADGVTTLQTGQTIRLTIVAKPPAGCNIEE